MKTTSFLFVLLFPLLAYGQSEKTGPRFYVEMDKKSALQGEPFELVYRFERGDKNFNFVAPNWSDSKFDVLGSSQSSSVSIVQGKVSSSATYSYQVMARDTGLLDVPIARMKNGQTEISSEATQIMITADPDYTPMIQEEIAPAAPTDSKQKRLKTIRI